MAAFMDGGAAGLTVGDLLHNQGCLNEDQAARVMEQLAEAVQHLHSHNIVHRDIKYASAGRRATLSRRGIIWSSRMTPCLSSGGRGVSIAPGRARHALLQLARQTSTGLHAGAQLV